MALGTERTAAGIGQLLSHYALRAGLVVVVLFLLYGAVPGWRLPALLTLIAAGRSAFLAAEALRKRWQPEDWRRLHEAILAEARGLDRGALSAEAEAWGLPPEASADEVARAALDGRRRQYAEPRARRELTWEWLGLLTFSLLMPFAFMLFTREIVSLRSSQGVASIGFAAVCLALYAWPHRWTPSEGIEDRRSLYWALPFLPALILVYMGVVTHHPYLDFRRADRVELAAERVLSLENNVIAGAHADWVYAYARQLEEQGEPERAAELYRKCMELAPHATEPRQRLATLERHLNPGRARNAAAHVDPRSWARDQTPEALASWPFWTDDETSPELPRCRVDDGLREVPGTTVVIVVLGDVPAVLVDSVGDVLRTELALPVCRAEPALAMPDANRVRGVVFGRQWKTESLAEYFYRTHEPLPDAPLKYLLLTGGDIYSPGTNFLFSSTFSWGAVLSFARYGDLHEEWPSVRHRTAKQALGALIKSFDLPPSPDPRCVTSYSNGLPQFDAKGNRPNAETFRRFRERVDAQDERWRRYKERRARAGLP